MHEWFSQEDSPEKCINIRKTWVVQKHTQNHTDIRKAENIILHYMVLFSMFRFFADILKMFPIHRYFIKKFERKSSGHNNRKLWFKSELHQQWSILSQWNNVKFPFVWTSTWKEKKPWLLHWVSLETLEMAIFFTFLFIITF